MPTPPLDWMDWRNDLAMLTDLLPESVRGFDMESWGASLTAKGCRNNLSLLLVSSVLFYQAEKGQNPKVNDIWDAFVYCSTCLNVGYGDIFARTPAGKIIGTLLMTFGPPLNGSMLNGPAKPEPANDATQQEMLRTLQQILVELKTINRNPASPPSHPAG